METVKVVDYAMPCMMAEKALKKLHEAMLARDYDKALEQAKIALVECRLAYTSILHEKDKHDQRRA
jgi:hypothetical protein